MASFIVFISRSQISAIVIDVALLGAVTEVSGVNWRCR